MEQVLELIKPLIETLLGGNGILLQVVAIVGSLRLILKPVMTAFQAYVLSTPSTKDDELYNKVESSKIYKWVVYALDYIASIKVKK